MEGINLRTVQTINVAKLWRDYDDSNPDIGMGPSTDMVIDNALKLLHYTREQVDMPTVRAILTRRR